jgi:hypothetical protein
MRKHTHKRLAQVVEHLPRKHEDLRSDPTTGKKKGLKLKTTQITINITMVK